MSVMAPKSNNDSNDSIPFHNLRTMARHSMEMDFLSTVSFVLFHTWARMQIHKPWYGHGRGSFCNFAGVSISCATTGTGMLAVVWPCSNVHE